MKLPAIFLSLFLLLPSGMGASDFTANTTPFVRSVTRSIVKVEFGNLEAEHAVCTGFVTSSSKGEALTAQHCLPDNGEILYVDGKESKLIRADDKFALIEVPKMTKPPLEISQEEALIGSEVFTFGYGWGYLDVFHRWVAAFRGHDLMMDGSLAHGMSGGPVVNLQGEVVALNQMGNDVVSLGCGVKEIRQFLHLK